MKLKNVSNVSLWRWGSPLISALLLFLMALKPTHTGGAGVYIGWFLSVPFFVLYLLGTAALLWLWAKQGNQGHWRAFDFLASALLLVMGLKMLTGWPRPLGAMDGFPSGHTTLAFGLAWLVAQAKPRLAPLWFAVAFLIGWARVEVQAHFDYQVAVGAALGCGLGWLVGALRDGLLFPRLWAWRRGGKRP